MPKGGHAHSGPARDPGSGRSERRGFSATALPNEGYQGNVPNLEDYLPEVTDRHLSIWAELWSTPQAAAWARESYRWPAVADLVRWSVRADDLDAPVAVATAIRQLRDDLGLSSAGLRANGWNIAAVQVGEQQPAEAEEKPKRERRLREAPAAGDQ